MRQIANKVIRQNNSEHNTSNTLYAEELNSIASELKNILIKYNIAFDDNNNSQIANVLSSLEGSINPAAYYTDVAADDSSDTVNLKSSNGIAPLTKYENGLIIYFKEFLANRKQGAMYSFYIAIDNLAKVKYLDFTLGYASYNYSLLYENNTFWGIPSDFKGSSGSSWLNNPAIKWSVAEKRFQVAKDLPRNTFIFAYTNGQPNWTENITINYNFYDTVTLKLLNFSGAIEGKSFTVILDSEQSKGSNLVGIIMDIYTL